MRAVLGEHGAHHHRCNGPDPIPVLVHLKVFSDRRATTGGDDAKRFVITDDLGGTYLRSAHATVTEAGTGNTVIQVHNITTADDLLTTKTTIDSGDTNSYDAVTQHAVDDSGDPQVNYLTRGDVLRIDIDTGSDATGLEVLLEFGPTRILVS